MSEVREKSFAMRFAQWAVRIRRRLVARSLCDGLVAGLSVAWLGSLLAWWLRTNPAPLTVISAIVVGAGTSVWLERRRRWSDIDVALYIDATLQSQESVTTVVDLNERGDGESIAYLSALDRANETLSASPTRQQLPRIAHRRHSSAVLLIAGLAVVPLLPPRPLTAAQIPEPGSEQIRIEKLNGLEPVLTLDQIEGRDEAQAKRLKQLRKQAKDLERRLQNGMSKRQALSEIAKLRDAIAREQRQLGSTKERAGLEDALKQMQDEPLLDEARQALGDRNMTRFDEQMQRLANRLEKKDRERALKALERARRAAEKRNAQALAQALERQKQALTSRGAKNDALRQLGRALRDQLSPEAREALEQTETTGDPEAQRKLARALNEALESLSESERKRLTKQLQERVKNIDPDRSRAERIDPQQLKQLSEQLQTKEGLEQLKRQLKEQAKAAQPNPDAERQRRLGEAQRGLGSAQRQMRGQTPLPLGAGGTPLTANGNKPGGSTPGSNGSSRGTPGAGPGAGTGPEKRTDKTKKVEGQGLPAHARSPIGAGAPNPGTVVGRTPGRATETANRGGAKALGHAAPNEVGAVQRDDIPKEYREQVGRYFRP